MESRDSDDSEIHVPLRTLRSGTRQHGIDVPMPLRSTDRHRRGRPLARCSWPYPNFCGKAKMKDAAVVGAPCCPDAAAVVGDNTPADCQTHAQAIGLGGEEGSEDAITILC